MTQHHGFFLAEGSILVFHSCKLGIAINSVAVVLKRTAHSLTTDLRKPFHNAIAIHVALYSCIIVKDC
jgi:hypothetical protein